MTPLEEKRINTRENYARLVMSTPEGRAFVWGLLVQAGCFSDTFAAGAPDVSAYRQGRRAQGLDILEELKRVCPNLVRQMRQEDAAREAVESVPEPVDPPDYA